MQEMPGGTHLHEVCSAEGWNGIECIILGKSSHVCEFQCLILETGASIKKYKDPPKIRADLHSTHLCTKCYFKHCKCGEPLNPYEALGRSF